MTDPSEGRVELDRLIAELRPKLHRYCARMTGSVIDGDDVVQEALLKAVEGFPRAGSLANPEGWLFRIAHNAALDFLRRRARHDIVHSSEGLEMVPVTVDPLKDHQIAAVSLRTFMRLPASQRSSVILRDVLGYSLGEVRDVTGGSVPAIKSALQRGRARLRQLSQEPDDVAPPMLAEPERARLAKYVDCFNAGDFDAIRDMLADDVRLDLVNRLRAKGRDQVGEYLHRYALANQWRFAAGFVDGRPAMLVFDRHDLTGRPAYFVLLDWTNERVVAIRDFLCARYALEGAELSALR